MASNSQVHGVHLCPSVRIMATVTGLGAIAEIVQWGSMNTIGNPSQRRDLNEMIEIALVPNGSLP